jgi:ribosome maturation factor RimP
LSKTAAKKLAKQAAKDEAEGVAQPAQVDEVLGFTLDEIREARLVPQVSVNGRSRRAATPAAGDVAVDEAQELGGQKK